MGDGNGAGLVALMALATLGLGSCAALTFANLHDTERAMNEQIKNQTAELHNNPSVFVVTEPAAQPAGTDVAAWTTDSRDHLTGTHHVDRYRVRFGPSGASLSGPTSTGVKGRTSAPVVPCGSLHVEADETHNFPYQGHAYRVVLTMAGNAVVCQLS